MSALASGTLRWEPAVEDVADISDVGFTLDEAYALLGGTPRDALTAAANAGHTGAMIALVPSDADVARLAVDGGEDPAQLHLTLVFLGEAAAISDETRAQITDIARRAATAPIEANAFSVNVFNPTGPEPCVVLGVGNAGPELANVQATVLSALRGLAGLALPDQHTPWVPHVTLAYTNDPTLAATLADRTGPITFDKIRVAFGDVVENIPLTPQTAAFWNKNEHPRDLGNGEFVDVPGVSFVSRVKSAAQGKRALGSARSVSDLEGSDPVRRDAATFYLAGGYRELNAKHRVNAELTHVENIATDRLDAMTGESRLSRDVVVSRGISNPEVVFGSRWNEAGDNTGLEWRDNAFVSTTVQSNVSEWHAQKSGQNPVIMRILVPVGTGALHLDDRQTDSRQLLLQRKLTYRIVQDHGRDSSGVRHVDVEVSGG